jgi:hypothetical protein
MNEFNDGLSSNWVEIKSNKKIAASDKDLIIMFLESPKLSGGGNIISYELDTENYQYISVNYEQRLFKNRILAKKTLVFYNYTFLINDFEKAELNFKLDDCTLILKNINHNEDLNIVQMFAESLVVTDNIFNETEHIIKSIYFKDVYFVKFKSQIDIEKCIQRLMRRPTLHGKSVELCQAYFTHSLIFKSHLEPYSINEYFLNEKKFPHNPLVSIREIESFTIICFDSETNLKHFLSDKKKHNLFKKIDFEYLHNFNLIIKQSEHLSQTKNIENDDEITSEYELFNSTNKLKNKLDLFKAKLNSGLAFCKKS